MAKIRCGIRQPRFGNQRARAAHFLRAQPAHALRQVRRHNHAGAHRLAMQPRAIPHARFDRMTESVAEVE